MDQPHDLTIILKEASGGDREAMGRIVSLVYGELRAIARRQHAGEQAGHSLNTTGIVHEAYLKLVKLDRISWQNREQFFAIAARSVRQILVDHARKRKAVTGWVKPGCCTIWRGSIQKWMRWIAPGTL